MSPRRAEPDVRIIQSTPNRIEIEGELSAAALDDFNAGLVPIAVDPRQKVHLDLSRLDIDDGIGVAAAVQACRRLHLTSAGLVIIGSPQILAHNLYRVGLLGGESPVTLIEMRQDEAGE
jgi:anti-anti-sigma regulatory factor